MLFWSDLLFDAYKQWQSGEQLSGDVKDCQRDDGEIFYNICCGSLSLVYNLLFLRHTDYGNAKKKPAKSSNEAKNKAAAEPDITITRLDIRVGLIKKAQKLLDADELYVEEIDIGEEQTRNVFELVEPPSSAQPGERITFPGYEGS
ncbi:hypothetical protein JHK87_030400 [Glycine soja]|nr:hypothetical protein JHK87_030400 [Glycine soja]